MCVLYRYGYLYINQRNYTTETVDLDGVRPAMLTFPLSESLFQTPVYQQSCVTVHVAMTCVFQDTVSIDHSLWAHIWNWRDNSVVKNTHCSYRGSGFDSQYSCGSSQLSLTPVPGNSTLLHGINTYIQAKHFTRA